MPAEILRGLCEAFRIKISYDRETLRAHYTAESKPERSTTCVSN
jgi:hypothetical protein